MQSEMYYLRGYCEQEASILARYLREGDIFIDVGANIGLFSLVAAKVIGPAGRVLAFEPASDTAQRLHANAVANGLADRIEILPVALSDSSAEFPLSAPEDHPRDTGRRSFFETGPLIESVRGERFDELQRMGEIALAGTIGAIKIDVEGAELMVLRGMQDTIGRFMPRLILVETVDSNLDRAGTSSCAITEFLNQCGFVPLPGNAGDGRKGKKVYNRAFIPKLYRDEHLAFRPSLSRRPHNHQHLSPLC